MTYAAKMRDVGPGLLALAIGVACLLWSQAYVPRERAMPELVGWFTIVLALIDIAGQFDTKVSRILRQMSGMELAGETSSAANSAQPAWSRIGLAMLWTIGYGVGIIIIGLLVATPIYIVLYMVIHGRKTLGASALSAAIITFAIWVTFERLFHYPLYPGLLLGGR